MRLRQLGLAAATAALLLAGCQDTGSQEEVESHQTTTMIHEEPGTGGSGSEQTEANCEHDPSSNNPCLDSFVQLPGQNDAMGVGGSGDTGQEK